MPSDNNSSLKEEENGNFEEKKRDTPSKVKKPNLKLVD
jgi:hypothetical protein